MQDVYENIEEYKLGKKRKVLIVFDDMIADMINNNKLNFSIVVITHSYFKVPKEVRLNTTHFFIMKIPSKRELQETVLNHSSDVDFKNFIKISKVYCRTIFFLVNDTTLPSDNLLRFRKNLLEEIFRITYNKS